MSCFSRVSDECQGIPTDDVELVLPIEMALQDLSYPFVVLDVAVSLASLLFPCNYRMPTEVLIVFPLLNLYSYSVLVVIRLRG